MITTTILGGLILGGAYATLLIYAGITQYGKNEFPNWSLAMLVVLGVGMDLALILRWSGETWTILFIILGLVGIQCVVVYNGWYEFKRINFKHQSVRVVLSLSIIVLLLL